MLAHDVIYCIMGHIPLSYKGSTIIPMKCALQYSFCRNNDDKENQLARLSWIQFLHS